jgi:hypothetical protein
VVSVVDILEREMFMRVGSGGPITCKSCYKYIYLYDDSQYMLECKILRKRDF